MNCYFTATLRCAVLAALVALALPSASRADGRPNSLRQGAWALQFGIADNFRLTSYEGGFFSVKRHFSDRSALRAMVDGGFSTSDSGSGSTSSTYHSEAEYDQWDIGLNVIYQRYLNPGADVAVYFGVGPSVSYESSTRKNTSVRVGTDSTAVTTSDQNTSRVGGMFVFGAEFFATSSISLHAEYNGSLRYSSSESTSETKYYNNTRRKSGNDSDGWTAGAGSVRFGLSAYF